MRDRQGSRARRAAAMWRLVEQFEGCGLSQVEFCRRRGIALSTFQYWRRRVGSRPRGAFAEIEIVEPASEAGATSSGVELLLPGGVVARIGASASEEMIGRILRAARASC